MQNEVADYATEVKSHAIEFNPATTLFFIAGGLNDGKLPEGTTATNEKDEIHTLYGLGARHFVVALLTTEIPGFRGDGQEDQSVAGEDCGRTKQRVEGRRH
jgi:hypothetical protein